MPNLNQQTPIVVVYKKRKYGKVYLEVFYNTRVDDIIDGNKRKPLINNNYQILEICVGTGFEERYKKKYKLK